MTRADFYIGKDKGAVWLGSIAHDGYPSGIPQAIRAAHSPEEYKAALVEFARRRPDWTEPSMGWPWLWENSWLADFAYTFWHDHVEVAQFGSAWQRAHPLPEIIISLGV